MADEEQPAATPAPEPAEGATPPDGEAPVAKPSLLKKLMAPKVLMALVAVLGGGAGAGAVMLFGHKPPPPPPAAVVAPKKAPEPKAAPTPDGREAAPEFEEAKAEPPAAEEAPKEAAPEAAPAKAEGGKGGKEGKEGKEASAASDLVYKFEPLVANVVERNSIHYLKLQLVAECDSAAGKDELAEKNALIRDALLFIISDMTLRELLTAGGKALLKEDIKSMLNEKLSKGKVRKLYITEFTVQ